jgi:hypothetical protein
MEFCSEIQSPWTSMILYQVWKEEAKLNTMRPKLERPCCEYQVSRKTLKGYQERLMPFSLMVKGL